MNFRRRRPENFARKPTVRFAEGLLILATYEGNVDCSLEIDDDRAWAGPLLNETHITENDQQRLRQLGWYIDDKVNRWGFLLP